MSNGTVTMEVALKALGIGWGDEVIVPALTFAATAYAAVAAGALPVVVDIEPERWTIDPAAVEAAITPRTRAMMPVHLGQQMCDMDALTAIADRHGLAIVEDCAHAHGQRWNDRGAGCDRRVRLVQPPVEQGADGGRGRHAADQRPGAGPPRALDHRLRAAEGRRRAASTRSAATTGWASCNCALLCTQLDRYEEQRAERERGAGCSRSWQPACPASGSNTIDPRITPLGLLPVPVRDRPRRVRRRGQRGRGRGARGRGHPGRAPVPADEPLRPVPAAAVAAAGVRRARRGAGSVAVVVPGCRGGGRAPRRLPQRERVPGRRARASSTWSRRSPRCSATPTSCVP